MTDHRTGDWATHTFVRGEGRRALVEGTSTLFERALDSLNLTSPLNKVIATANANLVTLYVLEAAGLRGYSSADLDRPF